MTRRPLFLELLLPLIVFYGLRLAGTSQFVALLAGALVTAAATVVHVIRERRVGGIQLFVLGTMVVTVAVSFISGNPRVLLIRNGWGTAALGIWCLLSLAARRPFLYEGGRLILPPEKAEQWAQNWESHEVFRNVLRTCTAVWGVAFLVDAAVRVVMAATLPIDVVPLLDDVLLVVTLVALVVFQRTYARSRLHRDGLRLRGVRVVSV
ncbi:VC0807 family protein [Kribbella sp. NPDC055071]